MLTVIPWQRKRQALEMAQRHSRKIRLIFIKVPIKSGLKKKKKSEGSHHQACFYIYSCPEDRAEHWAQCPAAPEGQVTSDKSHKLPEFPHRQ